VTGSLAPMELPRCPTHPEFQMALRPDARQTYEQKFCGVWYDCLACSQSVLFKSKELEAHLAGFAAGTPTTAGDSGRGGNG
jgi:hypothetical protein